MAAGLASHLVARLVFGLASRSVPGLGSVSRSVSDLGSHSVARLVFGLVSHSVSDLGLASHSVPGLVFGLASHSVPGLGLASRSVLGLGSASHSVPDLGLASHSVPGLGSASRSVPGLASRSVSDLGSASRSVPGLGSASHPVSGLGLASRSVLGLGSASHLVARLVFGLVSRSVPGLGLASHSVSDLGSDSHSASRLVQGLDSHSVSGSGSVSRSDSPIRRMRYRSISLLRYSQALPLLPDLPDRLPLPYASDTVLLQHLPDLHCNPVLPHYSYNPPDCQRMYHIHHSGRQQGLPAMYNGLPVPVLHHLIWMLRGDADILPHSHYSRLQNNVSPCYFQADISSVLLPSCCNYRLSWITFHLPDRRSAP